MLSMMAAPALAHDHEHEGDYIVGRTAAGQLTIDGPRCQRILLPAAAGPLLYGWVDTDPGFDALNDNDPAEDLYVLQSGCSIRLEAVTVPVGVRFWSASLTSVADAPGERVYLGGSSLHSHPFWHIDSNVPDIGPDFEDILVFQFRLVDTGSTGYAASDVFTVYLTNLPAPQVEGDVDGDGHVNAIDLLSLARTFAKSAGDEGFDPRCDFNLDGVVNAIDLLILAHNWNT